MKALKLVIVLIFTTIAVKGQPFLHEQKITENPNCSDFALYDFNNDGIKDIVYSSYNEVSYYLGKPEGGYEKPIPLFPTTTRGNIILGDLDGDGNQDIVFQGTNNYINQTDIKPVLFYKNTGGFNFEQPIVIIDSLTSMSTGVIKDIEGNGSNVLIFSYRPTGVNRTLTSFTYNSGSFIKTDLILDFYAQFDFEIEIEDIDGDGDKDVVSKDDYKILIYKNNNGFNSTPIEVEEYPYNILCLGDLDGDNDLDIVTTSYDKIYKHNNLGNGVFSTKILIKDFSNSSATLKKYHLSCQDLNNNGQDDIIVYLEDMGAFNGLYYLMNEGNGEFDNYINFNSYRRFDQIKKVKFSDVNNDNFLDALVINYKRELEVHESNGGHFNGNYVLDTLPTVSFHHQLVDINNDGRKDILSIEKENKKGNILLSVNTGGNQYADPIAICDSFPYYIDMKIIDVNNDGFLDINISSADSIFWYKNDQGSFNSSKKTIETNTRNSYVSLNTGFINNDSLIDLYYIDYGIAYYSNLGANNFSNQNHVPDSVNQIKPANINSDIFLDYFQFNHSDSSVSAFINNNGNSFTELSITNAPKIPDGVLIQLEDMDNNGLLDFVYTHQLGVSISYQNSYLTFSPFQNAIINYEFSYRNVQIVDIDHDGDLDINVGANQYSSATSSGVDIKWVENLGNNTYSKPKLLSVEAINLLTYEDINQDGNEYYIQFTSQDSVSYISYINYNSNSLTGPLRNFYTITDEFNVRDMYLDYINDDDLIDIYCTGNSNRVNQDKQFINGDQDYDTSEFYYQRYGDSYRYLHDINNNGSKDIIKINETYSYSNVYAYHTTNGIVNSYGPIFQDCENTILGNTLFGDITGDNIDDALVYGQVNYNSTLTELRFYEGLGNGEFELCETLLDTSSLYLGDITLHDKDFDGDLDILIESYYNQSYTAWIPNLGGSVFGSYETIFTHNIPNFYYNVKSVDLNNNAKNELLYSHSHLDNNPGVYFMDTIQDPYTYSVVDSFGILMDTIDFDKDNDIDILMVQSDSIYILLNNGLGEFPTKNLLTVARSSGYQPSSVQMADKDNDGDLDLYVHKGSFGVSIFSNFNITTSETDSTVVCNVYITHSGDTLTTNQTFTDTIPNSFGGDSIRTVHLTFSDYETVELDYNICMGDSIHIGNSTYFSSGLYTDTLVNQCGFDSIVSLNLQVNQPNSWTYADTICLGESLNFNGNLITQPGSYSDTLINIDNCDSIIHLNLALTNIVTTVTVNNSTLSVPMQPNAEYQWLDCNNANAIINGANSNEFNAISNGNYAVKIDLNGCSETSNCTQITGIGIEEMQLNDVNILPNPTRDFVTVKMEDSVNEAKILLSNSSGELLLEKTIRNTREFKLNLNGLPNGIYFINLDLGSTLITKKVIKIK